MGSVRDNQNGGFAGSVYLFEYKDGTWQEMQKIIGNDTTSGDFFGHSVSLGHNRALVGARTKTVDGVVSVVAVYVFELSNDVWVQTAKLMHSTPQLNVNFGYSVGLVDNNVLIGAPGSGNGSVEFFTFDEMLLLWNHTHSITTSDGSFGDRFGESISMSTSQAIIGANNDDTGSAYLFDYLLNIQQDKITAENGFSSDSFGQSVSLYGNRVLVGAPNDDENGNNSGAAYVFELDTNNSQWLQTIKLTADDSQSSDKIGYSVSLYADEAFVGSFGDDNINGGNSGSAYLYKMGTVGWSQSEKFLASDGSAADELGKAVFLSPEWAIIGADKSNNGALPVGATYIYQVGILFVDDLNEVKFET